MAGPETRTLHLPRPMREPKPLDLAAFPDELPGLKGNGKRRPRRGLRRPRAPVVLQQFAGRRSAPGFPFRSFRAGVTAPGPEEVARMIRILAIPGHPIEEGRLPVACTSRVMLRSASRSVRFGPSGLQRESWCQRPEVSLRASTTARCRSRRSWTATDSGSFPAPARAAGSPFPAPSSPCMWPRPPCARARRA